ncbi:MAG: FAD-dependent oxidoreductase [Alphaproteobacteria bacterium]|nr:FAD-dependent oxidoreductase [Alphaproteobacteria bacterium]
MVNPVDRALGDTTLFPFWLDSPDAPSPAPPLIGRTEADLVIVGGGFTGLWAAVQGKEADPGRDIVLVEAGKVAHGASGRPGGIISTSIMHGLSNAARIFPKDLDVLERLGQENLDGFAATLERHGIDGDIEWNGEMTVAVDPAHLPDLDDEYELHKKHGYDVVYLDRAAVQAEIASPLYHGAVWSRQRSGIVHPAKLAWGLRRAAIDLGVRLYEDTPLTGLERDGAAMAVRTHDGLVRAPKVLLATNAFAAGDRRITRRVAAIRDRIIATEPLTEEQLGRIGWVHRQGVYDTRTQLNYTRLTKDNRIIFGGRVGYYFGNDTDPAADRDIAVYRRLAETFFTTFPQLDDVRFSHAWGGPIALSTRMAVHFQRYHGGRAIWAGGYSGFGVSTSRFGARLGLALLDDPAAPELKLDLATTLPNWIPPEPFRWIGAKITMHAIEDADTRGGWRRAWVRLVHWMGFPL